MKSFFRRLFRFVRDPRYGLCYSPSAEECKKAWESVIGDSFTRPFSLEAPKPETGPSFIAAYRDLDPPLEWPDFLGNGLFVVFCTWVLYRALLSAEGFCVFLLLLLVIVVGLVRPFVEVCRLAWPARFSHRRGAGPLRRGCGAARRVMFDTSPLPGWRMRSCAPVCERLGCQPLAQVPISYAIFLPRAVLRHFRAADSA